eukprot:29048-Eustigmatos_ZCMA.PRE.1
MPLTSSTALSGEAETHRRTIRSSDLTGICRTSTGHTHIPQVQQAFPRPWSWKRARAVLETSVRKDTQRGGPYVHLDRLLCMQAPHISQCSGALGPFNRRGRSLRPGRWQDRAKRTG